MVGCRLPLAQLQRANKDLCSFVFFVRLKIKAQRLRLFFSFKETSNVN